MKAAVENGHVLARGIQIDMVGFNLRAVFNLTRQSSGCVYPTSDAMMLLCCGLKCWITTNAMLLSGGMMEKKAFKVSNPPAEAPMPTIGKRMLFFWFFLLFNLF